MFLYKINSSSQPHRHNVVAFEGNKNGCRSTQWSNFSNVAVLNMNQCASQTKTHRELTSGRMYTQRMVRLRLTQNQRQQILPWFGSSIVVPQGLHRSSSTPPAADVLYGNDSNGRLNQFSEDVQLSQNSLVDIDKNKDIVQQKSKDFDKYLNNRGPSSRALSKKSSFTIDPDRDREDPLKNLTSTLPLATPSSYHRPNGIKGNLIKGEQFYSTKSNGTPSGHEQDDLIAMGTIWSPNNPNPQPSRQGTPQLLSSGQQQQMTTSSSRNNGISNNSINSYPFKVIQSSGSVSNSMSASNNILSVQRKFPNTSTSIRPILVQNNGISTRKNSNILKEQEDPKYADPMIGAPPSFQQRIIELGALEGDTVRWERSKRLKKKKQDRDS